MEQYAILVASVHLYTDDPFSTISGMQYTLERKVLLAFFSGRVSTSDRIEKGHILMQSEPLPL